MTLLLCILDGFGLREPAEDNAIAAANTPNYDKLTANQDHVTNVDGSGLAVGLPAGQMGNSEVGHLNIGAGRVVYQDVCRIDRAIESGELAANKILQESLRRLADQKKALHLLGLVSDGLVHSSLEHLYALVELAKQAGVGEVYLHAFTDGRDTPPHSGQKYMTEVVEKFESIGLGQVATVSGRYFGMDRDKRWDRVERSYRAIVDGEGKQAADPVKAISESYEAGVTDEFIEPIVIDLGAPETGRLKTGDTALIFNFRADRVRQLSYEFLGYEIDGVDHPNNPQIELLTMTEYDKEMTEAKVLFDRVKHENILGEILANNSKKQLRTAETEKYAHVTFFFNGGVEQPFDGEDRNLIPSPKVATYDLKPEMSSVAVTDNALKQIESGKYDLIVLNYANCDMVGHTGVFEAAKKAVEAVDTGLGQLLEKIKQVGGVALVTADHGNAEKMWDPQTNGPFTAHTTSLVPFIFYDPSSRLGSKVTMKEGGILADIAPTILDILGLEVPKEMTGKTLIKRG